MAKKPPLDELEKLKGARERRGVDLAPGSSQQILALTTEANDRKIGLFIPFNSDSFDFPTFRERIAPGAFAKSIGDKRSAKEGRDVVALWNHDPNYVLGRQANGTLRLMESADGLEGEVTLDPKNPMSAVFAAQIERGDVRGASFGFETIKHDLSYDEEGRRVRTLLEVRLFDVSPVTYPAYPASEVDRRALDAATDSVANLCAGIDLAELRSILLQVRDGQAPLAARSNYLAHLAALQALLPPDPSPPVETDWSRRLALHERFARQGSPAQRMFKRPTDGKEYSTFEACVLDNGWADDPEGYCQSIKTGAAPGE